MTGTRLDEVMRVGAFVSGAWTRTGVLGSGRHARVCGSGGRAKQKRASGGGRNERQQWRDEKDDGHVLCAPLTQRLDNPVSEPRLCPTNRDSNL